MVDASVRHAGWLDEEATAEAAANKTQRRPHCWWQGGGDDRQSAAGAWRLGGQENVTTSLHRTDSFSLLRDVLGSRGRQKTLGKLLPEKALQVGREPREGAELRFDVLVNHRFRVGAEAVGLLDAHVCGEQDGVIWRIGQRRSVDQRWRRRLSGNPLPLGQARQQITHIVKQRTTNNCGESLHAQRVKQMQGLGVGFLRMWMHGGDKERVEGCLTACGRRDADADIEDWRQYASCGTAETGGWRPPAFRCWATRHAPSP